MITVTTWTTGQSRFHSDSFLSNGIKYQNGRIIVPLSGLYFIYSYLELNEVYDQKYITQSASRYIKHSMCKFNVRDGIETEITTRTVNSTVSANGLFGYEASYLSTHAFLRSADEISVKISDKTLLKYPEENFFGVYLL